MTNRFRALLLLLPMLAWLSVGASAQRGETLPAIDVLIQQNFAPLKGKRVGLITNHTGLTRDNKSIIDIFHESPKVNLTALYSPEHGIRGTADEKVASGLDEKTGLMVHSLYGKTQKPTPEMLTEVDVLVFDMQDIGTRFYTYIGTMSKAMEAAKENGKAFIVLDRPNPIGGHIVDGLVCEKELAGKNTAIHPIPTRHGMTVGELALMFNEHFGIGCDLTVIEMKNWKRNMYWDETGLLWVNPSPNMRTLNGAILYPGLGASETTSLSMGRGLDRPFEMYGAPFLDGDKVAAAMNAKALPGIRFVSYSFTPTAPYHKFKDEKCGGIFAIVTDREKLECVRTGLHMVQTIHEIHPVEYKASEGFGTLTGSATTWKRLTEDKLTPEAILAADKPNMDAFMAAREKYLLYK